VAEYLPSGEVNILPLFTEIEKNNCFSLYTLSDLNNILNRKPFKIDLKHWRNASLHPPFCFCLAYALFTWLGVNNAH